MTDHRQACDDPIHSEITAAWLTATLRAGGHLSRGAVTDLTVEPWRAKRFSDLLRLRARYSEEVALPQRFVLKRSRAEPAMSVARRRRWKEHEFYTRLVPLMAQAPVPRHFAAVLALDASGSLLLLEDLSTTHGKPPSPLPSKLDTLPGDVDCLAMLHAAWWENEDLRMATQTRDEAWTTAKSAAARRLLSRFLDAVGDQVSPAARQALDEVAAAWPAILQHSAATAVTVVHGDAHPWNFLTPRDPERDRTRLLDWEAWTIEPAALDLASLLALHLPRAARAASEATLLARYIQRLRQHGVPGYDLTQCHEDYRWAIARKMIAPAGMWSRGSQARIWLPMLGRITTAYHDLRCTEFLAH